MPVMSVGRAELLVEASVGSVSKPARTCQSMN